jgi:hypothetical protein
MIEIYPSPGHVAAFKISGTLTGEDYDRVVVEVRAKLAQHARLGVLVDLSEFEDFTAEAGWKDVRFSLSLLGDLERFPREAVISDKQWVRVLAGIAGPLVPHVELKVFGTNYREAAMTWVRGAREP